MEVYLHETNSIFAPENGGPLEKEIPSLETTIFRGKNAVSFQGGVNCMKSISARAARFHIPALYQRKMSFPSEAFLHLT